jgi:YD repeat-containing protein
MSDTGTSELCKGLSWTYDAWGNRTDQTVTSGTCNTFHNSVDTNNRLVGTPYQYDAAGNMIHDGAHSYTYDAENRITAVDGGSTANYYYDAQGYRVHHLLGTTSTLEYLYDLHGNVVSEVLPSGGLNASYLYLGNKLIAEYSSGTTHFVHQDHLGACPRIHLCSAEFT